MVNIKGGRLSIDLIVDDRRVDLSGPIDISIPMRFDGPQPNAFGVPRATGEPCQAGELIGDTRLGGSCNFEQYTFITHCNGTHTECVGHITHQRISIRECLKDAVIEALLVSVEASDAGEVSDSYAVPFGDDDRLITREILGRAFTPRATSTGRELGPTAALIVRTLPNHDSKLSRGYGEEPLPPYFTTEAMEYILECGFNHLLVDVPSIDRMNDEGKLSNHRIFWNLDQGSFEIKEGSRVKSTITEFIYVSNDVPDGEYALNLQIAPFAADASPSRPLLFRYLD